MDVAVIGAGPAGLLLGTGLARRGHSVTLVDRDPGPSVEGTWERRGVMQFHHAHGFRAQVVAALAVESPQSLDRLVEAGGELVSHPETGAVLGMRCRRATFEAALRSAALDTPGVRLVTGHVDAVAQADGRAAGLVVDGTVLPADLVVDASGRSGRATRGLRAAPTAGGHCGIAYVDRQYRLHADADPGPLLSPIAWQADLPGYQVVVFLHERGTFSVLVVRPSAARELVALRHDHVFEAACREIPGLADWTDPARSRPITSVLPGGALMNWYRGQRGPDGGPALAGLFFVGDSVCTTTPTFGRGVTTTVQQVQALLGLLDEDDRDLVAASEAFDSWCERAMRPWVVDHDRMDASQRQRWESEDLDLSQPLPSDLVMAAAQVDPAIGPYVGPYAAMTSTPDVLDPAQPLARAVYTSGWRPAPAPGPSRRELADLVARAL